MKNVKVIIIGLLIGVTVFSVYKYILALKEKNDLLYNLNQTKERLTALEIEKQSLLKQRDRLNLENTAINQEKSELQDKLRINEEKLVKLAEDFQATQSTVEQLNSHISLLKEKNASLVQEKDNLILEKDTLQVKLGSIAELKKTIKELKRKMRRAWTVTKKSKVDTEESEGNRGFLVRSGKSTYPAKIKIEVRPGQ